MGTLHPSGMPSSLSCGQPLKILIFEYITGGGFNRQPLPASLLAEGALMLRALLDDCQWIATLDVRLMLDDRCQTLAEGYAVKVAFVKATDDVQHIFKDLIATVDAVWLIAPEFDQILQGLTSQVEAAGKRLLTSSSKAVALAADKWQTFQYLQAAAIPTIHTALLKDNMEYHAGQWVIKPIDGVGCGDTWRIDSVDDFVETLTHITLPQNFIIQPFMAGRTLSLSCLFDQGSGVVLCVNEQVISVRNRRFELLACRVNCMPVSAEHAQLVAHIAQAIPGLHGYVGIDLIQAPLGVEDYWVVEINPRLTSSYVGIYAALGLNVLELVLQLPQWFLMPHVEKNVQIDVGLQS